MKMLLLGGKCEHHMDGPEWVFNPSQVRADETVVLISHGLPSESKLKAIQSRVAAALMMQAGNGADSESFRTFRQRCSGVGGCERIFRLTIGWMDQRFTSDKWKAVGDFLASSDTLPSDREVQRLLGFDSSVRRVALEFALQLAREQLDKPGDIDFASLLAPAGELVRPVEALASEFASLIQALDAPEQRTADEWRFAIDESLARLQPPAH